MLPEEYLQQYFKQSVTDELLAPINELLKKSLIQILLDHTAKAEHTERFSLESICPKVHYMGKKYILPVTGDTKLDLAVQATSSELAHEAAHKAITTYESYLAKYSPMISSIESYINYIWLTIDVYEYKLRPLFPTITKNTHILTRGLTHISEAVLAKIEARPKSKEAIQYMKQIVMLNKILGVI